MNVPLIGHPTATIGAHSTSVRARLPGVDDDDGHVREGEGGIVAEVVFEGVSKRFGDVVAVDDLNLTIADGEFMVLLGPSGCGKTTALRMIAGLETVSTGTLRIGDRVVNDIEAKDRDISMVFQSYALYPHMTVARNIESPLLARSFTVEGEATPRKLHRSERDDRVRAAAAALGLTDLLARKPAALSGGQRQRVALARGIVSRPSAFLMDEPLSNLDAKLRAQTRLEIVALHRELSTTFVYVTHDQVEAMTMANRIAIIEQGRLQQVGAPQAVYERPANLFVARFIGSPPMNTLAARLDLGAGAPAADLGTAGRIPLSGSDTLGSLAPRADGSEIIIGVRPEHLVLVDPAAGDPAAAGSDTLAATVAAVEWLGHERHVIAHTGADGSAGSPGSPGSAGAPIVVRQTTEGPAPVPGQTVRIRVPAAHVHVFDPVTTERLG